MIDSGCRMFAWDFSGYWKDVGTIASLWEANMDLLGTNPVFNLYDKEWRIYSKSPIMPPHYAGEDAVISNSLVTEGCVVHGLVRHSVLYAGVRIEPGAVVEDSIIMPNSVIERGAVVQKTIVGENAIVGAKARVGCEKLDTDADYDTKLTGDITLVASAVRVADGLRIPKGMVYNCGKGADSMNNSMFGLIYTGEANAQLRELTFSRSVAAVPFGGRYRAIDFMLSDIVNTGISNVGIITQRNYHL